MKKMLVLLVMAALAVPVTIQAEEVCVDSTLEQVLLLQFAEEMGIEDYDLMDILQGYREYRSMMDDYTKQRAEKTEALKAAIAGKESETVLMGLTRDLMALDMNILRLKQSSVNEASSLMSADAVAQLYLMVSNLEEAKAALAAELSGSPAAVCPCPMANECAKAAACAAAGTPACPMAAAAAAPAAAPAEAAVPPEKAIMERTLGFLNKLIAKELDAAMEGVSETFEHSEYGNKEELKSFLDQAIVMGYLDDAKVLTEDTEVKVEGDKAVVYPVDIEGTFGSATLELVVKLENGNWMLVGMDIFGI